MQNLSNGGKHPGQNFRQAHDPRQLTAVCQLHDECQADTLQHHRIVMAAARHDPGDKEISDRVKLLADASPGFKAPRPSVT